MDKLYKMTSVHWSNDNIMIYVYDTKRNVWDDATNIIDLSEHDFLEISDEFLPFFHVLPAIAHNRFISFINQNEFDDPESIVACNFIGGSFFMKGGFNNGL